MKFNDFSNNKPKYNLGDIVSIHSGINIPDTPDGEYYNLTMGSVTRNGKLVFSLRTNETNRLLCKGQLIMPTRDVGDCSIIGRTALIDKNNKYFAGNCLYVLTLKKGNPTYLHLYMNSNFARKQISKIIEGGSQKQITLNEIEKMQIPFPNLEEQDKIAKLFNTFEKEIEKEEYLIQKLKNIKQSFLERLFPNENNNNIPQLRFESFTDTWEQRKLGDCFDERNESMPDGELISVTINDGIRKFSELGRHDNSNDDKSKYKKVCVGDIAYNSMRMWQGASGYSPYEGIVSPAYTVLSPKMGVVSRCLAYQFKLPEMIHTFQVNSQGITSDNWNLKYPAFSEIEVAVAKQTEEQELIASFFTNLDHLITLHQCKCI